LFGAGSSVRPNSSNPVRGLAIYADGVVAVVGNNVYFSVDGTSWLQLNKDSVDASGDNYATFNGRSELTLTTVEQCEFTIYEGLTDYGELVITDKSGANKPFLFYMTGTGGLSTRTFFAKQITFDHTKTAKFCTVHDNHLVVAGNPTEPQVKNYLFFVETHYLN